MKILIVSATPYEITPTLAHMEAKGTKQGMWDFVYADHTITPLVTGVGMMHTAFALARMPAISEVDLAINVGIAGALDRSLQIGAVVEVLKDRIADLGVEESDGAFTDVYEMGLAGEEDAVITDGWISHLPPVSTDLRKVTGLTVNTVTGTQASTQALLGKYEAEIETMEGAAFLYACKAMDVKCLALRGVSNYVEERNREAWDIDLAINNVNKSCINLLQTVQPFKQGYFN